MKRPLLAVGLGLTLLTASALAQDQPTRIRGTIEHVDGAMLTVKARNGAEMKLRMSESTGVMALAKASLDDVKEGSFVGVAGMPQPDGSQQALEVHIFPESMRGTGEGHREWDLKPKSTMTNAAVEKISRMGGSTSQIEGRTLMMKYKGGEKKIVVPADAPVVMYTTGDRNELKPGVKIIVNQAKKRPDGTYEAARINYGKDGLTPPM